MKKLLSLAVMLVFGLTTALAQAEIKFDKVTQDLGTFSEESPVKKAVFTFTNVGNKPLVLNQVVASCGCTVPRYDKKPIAPGQKGTISVTYNGTGKFPGHFKKSITVRSNAKTELTRLYVEGVMTEKNSRHEQGMTKPSRGKRRAERLACPLSVKRGAHHARKMKLTS